MLSLISDTVNHVSTLKKQYPQPRNKTELLWWHSRFYSKLARVKNFIFHALDKEPKIWIEMKDSLSLCWSKNNFVRNDQSVFIKILDNGKSVNENSTCHFSNFNGDNQNMQKND